MNKFSSRTYILILLLIFFVGCSSTTSSGGNNFPTYLQGTWESERIEDASLDFKEKMIISPSNDRIKADITIYYYEGPLDSIHFSTFGTLDLPTLSFDNEDDSFDCTIRSTTVMNCEIVDPVVEGGILLFKQN